MRFNIITMRLLALFMLAGTSLKAQKPVRDTSLARLFGANASLNWTRYFKARLDDMNVAHLALGYDGKSCKGWMTLMSSGARLRLEGAFQDDHFTLAEYGADQNPSGWLRGAAPRGKIVGQWFNADSTLAMNLRGVENAGPPEAATPCAEGKWISRYIARWNNARTDMTLYRSQNNRIHGYLWIESEGRTYTLRGEIADNGQITATAYLANGKPAAHLKGSLPNPKQPGIELIWSGSGELRQMKFTLRESFPCGCMEYADFSGAFDALYPRTGIEAYNKRMEEELKKWREQNLAFFKQKKTPNAQIQRNALRASGWAEVVNWTDYIFSGYLTFSDNWSGKAQGISFNYHVKTGREITFDDLFVKTFDAQKWLNDYARREMLKIPEFGADPIYREWLNREGFPLFTLRRDWLELSSLFHPVYGRQVLAVPYAQLKPYMKKDNPIAEFVK